MHAPQQATIPSVFKAQVWAPPAVIWTTLNRPVGTAHWPFESSPACQCPAYVQELGLLDGLQHMPDQVLLVQMPQARTPAGNGAICHQRAAVAMSSRDLGCMPARHAENAGRALAICVVTCMPATRCSRVSPSLPA